MSAFDYFRSRILGTAGMRISPPSNAQFGFRKKAATALRRLRLSHLARPYEEGPRCKPLTGALLLAIVGLFFFTTPLMASPDLVVTRFAVSPLMGRASTEVTVILTIENLGTTAANGSLAELRMSAADDVPFGPLPPTVNLCVPSLAAGSRFTASMTLKIPAGSVPGARNLWLLIDSADSAGQDASAKS